MKTLAHLQLLSQTQQMKLVSETEEEKVVYLGL